MEPHDPPASPAPAPAPAEDATELATPPGPLPPLPASRATVWRGVALPSIALLVLFLGFEARTLWAEWHGLKREWARDARSRVIGYSEVTPDYSHAQPPEDWFHDEGDHSLLWARWDRRENKHVWFRVGRGEIDPSRLSHCVGRDTVRAIESPRVEVRGGQVWGTIPDDHRVATTEFKGAPLAYPLAVLDKVLIINDEVPTSPLLVVFSPFEGDENAATLYNPVLDSERLIMGHSGYLCDGQPLLYDRRTESLWVSGGRGLVAVAGRLRGAVLKRFSRLAPVEWGTWRDEHPDTRLVVGSVRPRQAAARR